MKSERATAPYLPSFVIGRNTVLSSRSPFTSLTAQGSGVAAPFFETTCGVDFFSQLSSSLCLKYQDLQGSRAGVNLNFPFLRLVDN